MTWFSEFAEANFAQFVPNVPRLRVCQIGVWEGDATGWLAANRNIGFQCDVDIWAGSQPVEYAKAERLYDERLPHWPHVQKYRMTSDDFFTANERTFHFVYIDGDHDPEQVYHDGINGGRCLVSGGVIAFDDYLWEVNGVRPSVGIDRMMNDITGFEVLLRDYQVWLVKR